MIECVVNNCYSLLHSFSYYRAAKNGKFDCSVMSLSVLLDYRPEDNKEHSFEASYFSV